MLHTTNDQQATLREQSSTPPHETLELFTSFLRRQYPLIIFVAVLGIAIGLVYLVTTPPSFTAQAQLLIDSRKNQLFQQQAITGDVPIDSAWVESQVELLKSENVALAVIKDLHLGDDPEFVSSGGGLLGLVGHFFSNIAGSSEVQSELQRSRLAMRAFQTALSVKRSGLSYVIEINFRSLNPDRAAQIANAIADAYIVDQMAAKYQATRRASIWLQDRIKELREQASVAERAVVEFRTKNNIVSTGGSNGRLVSEQQVGELNSQLVIARAQTAEARARLDRIESVLRADLPDASVNSTVADTLKNEVITKLRSQYLDLANREAEWSARYGSNHLAAVNLRNRMREIQKSILDELGRIAESYKSDYQIAVQREQGVQKELSEAVSQSQVTNQAQVALRELESNSQTYRSLYDNFLQRYMEAVQQQSFPITEARVISPASQPQRKSHPQTVLVLVISCFGALIVGLGLGLLRDLADRVFRRTEQIESILHADCIAVVPLLPHSAGSTASLQPNTSKGLAKLKTIADDFLFHRKKGWEPGDPKIIPRRQNLLWTVVDSPLSRYAESIRAIKLAVDLNGVVKPNKVIGFTSSIPNEGKSTLAVALAQLMSQSSRSVIVVDCDVRNPSISRSLTPDANVGLLEVVAGTTSLQDAIWKDKALNLSFLPAVAKARVAHSSEILASDAIERLFDQLKQSYDYIVVDLSPLAPLIDVRATTHFVDAYIFVVEWGGPKIPVVEHALGAAQEIRDGLLGVVLNKADMKLLSRYEGAHHSYYYNKNYLRYGYTE